MRRLIIGATTFGVFSHQNSARDAFLKNFHTPEHVDFHAVPLFNCGSLHDASGGHFWLEELPRSIEVIQNISKPCIAYKVLAAGHIGAHMGLGFASRNIKSGDVINLGTNSADNDNIV